MKRYQLLLIIAGLLAGSYVGDSKAAELNPGVYHCSNGYVAVVIENIIQYKGAMLVNGENSVIANTNQYNQSLMFTYSAEDNSAVTIECKR